MPRPTPQLAKLTRPRLHKAIARERLFNVLDEARETRSAVCVVGPPGAGKTTLVATWLDERGIKGIWYQLDPGDADLATFFHYLGQASTSFARKRRALPPLTPEYQADIQGFARRFFRELFGRLPPRAAIVLDNYQEVAADSAFHRIIAEAVDEVPSGILLVVVSRRDPPEHYARLTANEHLARVDWAELQLTLAEAVAVTQARGLYDQDQIRRLHALSQGWAAGLTLVLEQTRHADSAAFVPECGHDALFDYFASQILADLSDSAQRFLMQIAALPAVTVAAAQSLTGYGDAGLILEQVHQRNLFLDRHQGAATTYQFHALLRNFLWQRAREIFPAGALADLNSRAAALLEAEGNTEDAFILYCHASRWEAAISIALREAPRLQGQGRGQTLATWIEALPSERIAQEPWLIYWAGQARIAVDPRAARPFFVRASQIFAHAHDMVGEAAAAAGVMETYWLTWADFRELDPWIVTLGALLERQPAFPDAETEMRVYSALMTATHYRQPVNPWLQRAVTRVVALLDSELSDDRKVRAGAMLLGYAHAIPDLAVGGWLVDKVQPICSRAGVTPLSLCLWSARLSLHLTHKADYVQANVAVDRAEALAEEHAIAVDVTLRSFWAVLAALGAGDLGRAEQFVRQLEALPWSERPLVRGIACYCRCQLCLVTGELTRALESGREAVRIANAEGAFWTRVNFAAPAIYAMIEAREVDEAAVQIASVRELIRETFMSSFNAELELCEAAVALARGLRLEAHNHIRTACAVSRDGDYLFVSRAMPPALQAVLSEALHADVESEYLRSVIRRFGLWPGPQADDSWPWQFKIRALGVFSVRHDERPLSLHGKPQHRPFDVLKAILAEGGYSVSAVELASLLWPDAEGDAAFQALRTALHRLRRLLGSESAVRIEDGMLSLDTRRCWVDVWAFERACNDALKAQAVTSLEPALRALDLYQGHFLDREPAHTWTLAARERLQRQFRSLVLALGRHYEQQGDLELAGEVYERALARDYLAEVLYRALMAVRKQQGRYSDAANAYRRCREMLSAAFAVAPSRETQELYWTLERLGA